MLRKLVGSLLAMTMLVGCTGSGNAFKQEYEKLNGTTNKEGKEHRTIALAEDNPYVNTSAEEILDRMDKGETFYVYYGDPQCPWCRSVLETSIVSAEEHGVETIYAVRIWDDDHNEIFRDVYELKDGVVSEKSKGTETYYETLKRIGDLAGDYYLKDDYGTSYAVGEKRIFAPNYLYVKDGKVVALCDGISELQKDSRDELSEEIIKDEKKKFDEFFSIE